MRHALLLLIFCGGAGCNTLFPELDDTSSSQPDLALAGDANDSPQIQGSLCALGDVRDPRSCAAGVPTGMHVDVEETRDSAPVDATGAFTLPLSQTLTTATLAAADPSGTFMPTVTTVKLTGGQALGLTVPLVRAQVMSNAALQNGVALDSSRGLLIGWAVDANGSAEAGAVAAGPAGSAGPFYDGAQASQISGARATGTLGLVVFFNVPAGAQSFTIAAPDGTTAQFTLPIRANAATISLLIP